MNDSATIEQTTVSLGAAPRKLTRKSGTRHILPIGRYVTDGAIGILTQYWPNGGRDEYRNNFHQSPRSTDSTMAEILAPLKKGTREPIPFKLVSLTEKGEPVVVAPGVASGLGANSYGFEVRYVLWVKKLGLSICWPVGSSEIEPVPYPICTNTGRVVGAIMPADSSHPAFARTARIAD